ncbi:hypothetical protein CGMCC3_g763 [Colletotrichum fructicola]|nr:uncharacterized protein CGMCC3_g763 [Colletotrichum fructicola]KAE9583024.1 hypothetical protein CGMCC3_g763 [Colletotrichum fructicola]
MLLSSNLGASQFVSVFVHAPRTSKSNNNEGSNGCEGSSIGASIQGPSFGRGLSYWRSSMR